MNTLQYKVSSKMSRESRTSERHAKNSKGVTLVQRALFLVSTVAFSIIVSACQGSAPGAAGYSGMENGKTSLAMESSSSSHELSMAQPAMEVESLLSSTQPAPRPAKISVTPKYPSPGQGGSQVLYIRVTDEEDRGVSGVRVRVTIHERGQVRAFTTDPTGSDGYTQLSYPLGASPPGYTVLVEASLPGEPEVEPGHAIYTPQY